ncbi:GNAT family N-acetyltransferase [Caenimonas koreensis]|uniref:GNAT family N-acetyltransferase n=1 Tax=Caenimonas koreensis DSM 17982 TaxID=1121255 RepID=A0A844AU43_9BURK|nr:GNAT family N-acetyltransferase [Caenimonas koreensis]MRD48010.1 GNAT family N-acetyltransferase [Caenimonas koreensis DSM 17982]
MTIAFHQIELQTDRLLLRPHRESDAPALFALYTDADVCRYLSHGPWTDIAQAHQFVARNVAGTTANEHISLAIVRKSDDVYIGGCSLFNFMPQCKRAELGYVQARFAWGHGYISEALQAVVAFAFNELDLMRLEADIDPRNTASARSLERLGFVKEGHLRERWIVNGEVSDSGLYGLLRADFKSNKSASAC